jgi:PAS domain S-box-containing protein
MKKRIRVLHIEVNANDRLLVKKALLKEHIEFEIVDADNPEKVAKLIASGDFDLVLTDINIPGFAGLQILHYILEKRSELPVIILTASGSEEIAVQAMKIGAADYKVKSVDHIDELSSSIRLALENKKEQDRLKTTFAAQEESETFYMSIFENASIAVLLTKPDGSIISANAFAIELFKHTEEEICKAGRNGIIDVTDSRLEALLEERTRTGKAKGELTCIKKDGSKFPAEVTSTVFIDRKGNEKASIIIRDLSEQKMAEEELEKQKIFFEQTFLQSATSTQILDKDGWCLRVNPKLSQLFGVKPEHIEGHIYNIFHDSEIKRNGIDKLLKNTFTKKTVEHWEVEFDIGNASQSQNIQVANKKKVWFANTAFPVLNSDGDLENVVVQHEDITDRRQAEEAIRQSEEQFRSLFMSMSEGFYISQILYDGKNNPCDYIYVEVNPMFEQIIGLSRDLIIGKRYKELVPVDTSQWLENYFKVAQTGEPSVYEFYSNEYHKYFETYSYLTSKNNITVFVLDITERHQSEESLRKERILLRTLIDNLPDTIYVKDQEGRKLIANSADLKVMNCSSEAEIIGKTDLEIFESESGASGFAEDMSVIKAGQPILNQEECFKDSEGKEHWRITSKIPLFDIQNNINGLVGFGHDITERKQAEAEILKSRTQLSNAAKIARLGHWEYDVAKDLFTFNDNFFDVFRTTIKQVGSYTMSSEQYSKQFVYWEDLPMVGEEIQKALETTDPDYNRLIEHRIVFSDGSMGYVAVSIIVIKDNQGRTIRTFGVNQDITERKHIEEELIKAKVKAEESDHLKTAFLHNISHEIRTPLNAIVGFTALLVDHSVLPEKRQHYGNIIVKSSDQLLSIITDIINIASIEAGQAKVQEKEINLNSTFKVLFQQFNLTAQNRNLSLSYKTDLNESEAAILIDGSKLNEILSNLIGNALKFCKEGFVKYGCSKKGEMLEFYVEDTGIGIPAELHVEIFKRFRQVEVAANREYGGSGLGLSISKAYVELMEGKIWLTSEPGKGTVFYFTVPYKKSNQAALAETETTISIIDKKAELKTILIAEDEDLNYSLLEELLSYPNYKLLRATNGIQAVEICKSNHTIDLVLMDIKMPFMNGYEATKEIKALRPELPVIAQTAYSTGEDRTKAISCGCSDFISKPFKQDQLLNKINEYLVKI